MDRVNNYLEGISTKDCVMTCNDTYSFQNRIKTIDSVLPIGDKRSFGIRENKSIYYLLK